MPTRAEVDAYQSVIDDLSTVAFAQVRDLLLALDDPNPIQFRDALLAAYPDLMAPFLSSASATAAQWYAELRSAARVRRPFSPAPVPAPPADQLDAQVRYSLTPIFKPNYIGAGILQLLAGATQKFIAQAGRDTITANAPADPTRVGWARIPRPGCCAFCSLLASRGAVYSEDTAGFEAHNFCRCVAAPVFGEPDAFVTATTARFSAIYDAAYQDADGTSRSAILTQIRAQQGVK